MTWQQSYKYNISLCLSINRSQPLQIPPRHPSFLTKLFLPYTRIPNMFTCEILVQDLSQNLRYCWKTRVVVKIAPVKKQKGLSQSVAGEEACNDEDTGVSGPSWISLDLLHPMENCIIHFAKKKAFTCFIHIFLYFNAEIDIRGPDLKNLLKFTQII